MTRTTGSRFEGKRILITGGTSGMGLAGALRIVAEGGEVAVTGTTQEHLNEAGRALPQASLVLRNDAADPDAARELGDKVKEQMGEIDGLWLNAGFGKAQKAEDVTAESFDAMMDVNVRGPALQMAELKPALKDGGAVVVTASTAAHDGMAQFSTYSATKGAVTSLTRAWAADLASRGVRVNSIAPGPIDTAFFESMDMSDKEVEQFVEQAKKQVPLGRFGDAEEAAAVALFLLSEDASYVTGSQYMVDGGLTMR